MKSTFGDLSTLDRNARASNSRSAEKLTFRKSENATTVISDEKTNRNIKDQILKSMKPSASMKPRPTSSKRYCNSFVGRTLSDNKKPLR